MIGFLIKLAILVVVGVLGYNYFFGTSAEKAQSAKTFGQMKEVAVSVGELAKSEKQKFDAGKYDKALDKLGATYKKLREGAQKLDAGLLKRINELEARKGELQKELDGIQNTESGPAPSREKAAEQERRKETLQRDLDKLERDSEALLKASEEKKAGR
jgi:predicted RNase H-like nuclease (RuvC/YqgF family)